MANIILKIIKFVVTYSIAAFYGFLVSLYLFVRLCKLRYNFFKKTDRTQVPACLQDASLGEHHYVVTKSGHKFHYVANGDIEKPLMLCIHGFPEFWFSWRFQLKEFCEEYRVVAFDMRGYGESYRPEGIWNYGAYFIVQDIKEIIEALGYSSCIILAHDWGGALAWNLAYRYPEVVDQLVIMNAPHPRIFQKHLQSNLKQFLSSWYIFFNVLPYLPEILYSHNDCGLIDDLLVGKAWTEEVKETLKYALSKPGAWTAAINYYRCALLYGDEQPWKKTKPDKKITIPTLVVWGDEDKALNISLLKDLDQYVENLSINMVEGASHFVHQDCPDVVNKHVWQFLKGSE